MQSKFGEAVIASERFACTLESAKIIRNWLTKQAGKIGLPSDTMENINLVVSELVTNFVKHQTKVANTILLQFIKRNNRYMLSISDDGSSFNRYKELADGASSNKAQDLKESGMGLEIIKTLFPEQNYSPREVNNSIYNVFSFYLSDEVTNTKQPIIAIVDDDYAVQSVLSAYLDEVYQVMAFENASLAIQYILQNPVDLIISDIIMPDTDGFKFRNELAQHSSTDTIPFIFLSAEETLDSQDQAAELGVDDYLVKPVKKNQLLSVIKRVLTRSERVKKRIGERLDTAITNSLKPNLPEQISGMTTALGTRAASAGGGDFVFHSKHDDFDMLIIGDIMGHGEQAKFFAHAHVGYFHGLMRATEMESSPAYCLSKLSDAIDSSPVLEATMVTCLAIRLNYDGSVTIASAGHPPPLVLENGQLFDLPVSGALPGLLPNQEYSEMKVLLSNKRLILYTDGLFESVENNEKRAALEANLKQLMIETSDLSPANANSILMARFDELTGGAPLDDVTLLILESGR